MTELKTTNHIKHLLLYHIIFVCKYRKKLLLNQEIADKIKLLCTKPFSDHKCLVTYCEVDKDHIHFCIEAVPNTNLSQLVGWVKSYSTYHIWTQFENVLLKYFWKERTFWTDGTFISTVGNVSENILKQYIENQG